MSKGQHGRLGRNAARLLVCIGIACLAGCTPNWHDSHKTFTNPYEQGQYQQAADAATDCAKNCVAMDKVLINMEAGAILRTAGKLPESTAAFDQADALVGDYDQWPSVRISEEAAAALTTVRNINYRGTLSDLVMLNTYRALNQMEMGNPDAARAMLIRAGFVQQDIADKYAQELRKAQDDLDQKRVDRNIGYDANRTFEWRNRDGKTVQDQIDQGQDKDLLQLKPYANYVNPFCDYLQGLFFMAAGGDQSDRERAVVSFRRAASMLPDNPYVAQDEADAERVAGGSSPSPTTYVIFETGSSPEMGQVQVPLPLFLLSNEAPTVVLYFPTIHARDQANSYLRVDAAGASFQTAVVSDMDAVIMQEFKNQLPTAITRMIIAAATKAAIDAGVKQGLKKESAGIQAGFDILSTVYQAEMNQADLRTWSTLPKQFQVARLPTPADHTINVSCGDGGSVPVQLNNGRVNVVYVKSVRAGLPLVVRQFVLNPGAVTPAAPAPPTTNTMAAQ